MQISPVSQNISMASRKKSSITSKKNAIQNSRAINQKRIQTYKRNKSKKPQSNREYLFFKEKAIKFLSLFPLVGIAIFGSIPFNEEANRNLEDTFNPYTIIEEAELGEDIDYLPETIDDATAAIAKREEELRSLQKYSKVMQVKNVMKIILDEQEAQRLAEEEARLIEEQNRPSLRNGIFKSSGVLCGQEDLVAEIADNYGIEPEFLASIICLESGYGTSPLAIGCNNFGGMRTTGDAGRTSSGYAVYSSVASGVDAIARNLARYPERYSDVNSVDISNVHAIGRHYCEGNEWAGAVTTIYNNIRN